MNETRSLSNEEKTILELLVAEIFDALPDADKVLTVLDMWITSNDLHPEDIDRYGDGTYSKIVKRGL